MTPAARSEGQDASASGRRIVFADVHKRFSTPDGRDAVAIDGLSIDIPHRQFVAIVGPSGCGKSTLLRLADGLIPPDHGQVSIGCKPPVPGPGIGLVFQNFRLLPWRSVADNVGFALEVTGLPPRERTQLIEYHLRQVGLERWSNHYPHQLSGGMKQRVALARALAGQPDVLLMDEPFANLDAQTRELMQEDLLVLCATRQPTVLFVTHSVDEALLLADRIIVMGAGRLIEDIEVALPRPRSIVDVAPEPAFAAQRAHLWTLIRRLVLADPASAFFHRLHGGPAGTGADH